MLEAQNLRKSFTSSVAVDNVSFRIARGEILGLIGPNGAGKTTTIRLLLNILQPDSGIVRYNGLPYSARIRRESGYLPEERGLYRRNRVLDTVLYLAELRGMKRRDARAAAAAWFGRLGLERLAGRRVDELSKGNQQKVQFISSVVHDPWLVILDEPFSGLDPVNQDLLTGMLLDLRKRGKAIIFSTHQMNQAEQLCDALCLIDDGRVVLEGPVFEVKRRFAGNAVLLQFSGDGSFLPSIPGVRNTEEVPGGVRIDLEDGADPSEFLRRIIDRVEIRRFELFEPTLQSIFLRAVGKRESE
jgi:ABC-2 type transport system ATP-binding protein